MAAKIKVTDEVIVKINELFLSCGVKAQVAREVGCSVATVNKYLIPNYVSKGITEDTPKPEFNGTIGSLKPYKSYQEFFDDCAITPEEWEVLKEIQKEVLI